MGVNYRAETCKMACENWAGRVVLQIRKLEKLSREKRSRTSDQNSCKSGGLKKKTGREPRNLTGETFQHSTEKGRLWLEKRANDNEGSHYFLK